MDENGKDVELRQKNYGMQFLWSNCEDDQFVWFDIRDEERSHLILGGIRFVEKTAVY